MIGLDFETFSSVDLKKHGMTRYIESPDFTVLQAAVAFDDGRPTLHFDFVEDFEQAKLMLKMELDDDGTPIAAFNASFERAVSKWLGYDTGNHEFVDAACTARGLGYGNHLSSAAPQMLGKQKVELGYDLIRVFSIPTKKNGGRPYTWDEIQADPELKQKWEDFHYYCGVDAELGLEIVEVAGTEAWDELRYELITQQMNDVGWFVDLAAVREMQRMYLENLAELQSVFEQKHGELNFRSYRQLQRWCEARGIKAKSFDKTNVPKLKARIERVLGTQPAGPKTQGYLEVLELLTIKEQMGGSSLSKLQTLLDHTAADGRLRGQYMHIGAGQTYRTSGRGVQMQNLARLNHAQDMSELEDEEFAGDWDNDTIAGNIRQVFKAEHPDGMLIVGDFSSIESRGLAYEAGEMWKLDAYRNGQDIYKLLAMQYSSNAGTPYEAVTKEQRQGGKVGELACGYGAGAGAVATFAEKMGIEMDEAEAGVVVREWRGANAAIVRLWNRLDVAMHTAVNGGFSQRIEIGGNGWVVINSIPTPASLLKQHPGAQSIELRCYTPGGSLWLKRVFHGCYYRGKDVCYYKPSELKGGDLWRARMTVPPHAWYKLYGGKLAGILTQSFCREMFFHSLSLLERVVSDVPNVKLIGQFHDEIVMEWRPPNGANEVSLSTAEAWMEQAMTDSGPWMGFPMAAEIKHDHRYTK